MKIRSIIIIIGAFCSLIPSATGQIGGVTGTKINALDHSAIDTGAAEFEPNYCIVASSKFWDESGDLQNTYGSSDSVSYESQISFRMAYAISDKWEVGTLLGQDFSNWSVKYALLSEEKLGLGIQGGINIPYGMTIIDKTSRTPDQISTYIFSTSGSYKFSESLSLDVNLQYQDYFHSSNELSNSDLFLFADVGKYLGSSKVLLMGSISYQISQFDLFTQNKFSFYPGIAFEMKDNFFLVLNGSFDLTGKNIEKTSGFAMAWTMTF